MAAARILWGKGNGAAALVLCYRALVQSGDDAPIVALAEGLRKRGITPMTFFVSSLKDEDALARLQATLSVLRPSVVLNVTSFFSGVQLGFDGVVFQGILASCDQHTWHESNGLPPRDIAMNIALPEMDGFVITRPLSFKEKVTFDESVQAPLIKHKPLDDRIDFVCELLSRWHRLRVAPRAEQNLALVMAQYPHSDGRLGNGVGLDTPESLVVILRGLKAQGYDVGDEPLPEDSDALMRRVRAVPTNALNDKHKRVVEARLSREDYQHIWSALPQETRKINRGTVGQRGG